MRIRRVILRTLVGLVGFVGLMLVGSIGWVGYLQLTGNVHAVEEGLVYRSNTLPPDQLSALLAEHGIKTVLNLRGSDPGQDWYQQESRIVSESGAHLVDLTLKSSEELTDDQLGRLIAVLETAPRPLLIHCRAGADRSGLASALYELLVEGKTPDEAASQLSFWYGHFPWLRSETEAMDRTFWRVVQNTSYAPPAGAR